MNIDETLVSQNTERLRIIYETKIKEFRKKIEVLHDKFHKRAQDRIFKTRYETAFGFFCRNIFLSCLCVRWNPLLIKFY